ncbi:MAG: hypothetical protein V4710_24660 [Verrucomicrobiota bacterium]
MTPDDTLLQMLNANQHMLITAAILSIATLTLSAVSTAEIYSGEPLSESLYDLAGAAKLISHELSSVSPILRTDVFRLADGRLV